MEASSVISRSPRFDAAAVERVAREFFGIPATAEPLPSERDQNFRLTSNGGERFVFKIANSLEGERSVRLQQAALAHVRRKFEPVQKVVPSLGGAPFVQMGDAGGIEHCAWCVTHIDGVPLALAGHQPPELLRDVGAHAALLGNALSDFDHAELGRGFIWNLAGGLAAAHELLAKLDSEQLGGREPAESIHAIIAAFESYTEPRLHMLSSQAVHGDMNDYNVLVRRSRDSRTPDYRVAGVIDFGDLVRSYSIAELAVAIAYVMLGKRDPLAAAAEVVRGYVAHRSLSEAEADALFGLACLRLCLSACIGAVQRARNPDNEYLYVSDAPVRRALRQLGGIGFPFAAAVMREAGGLDPAPSRGAITRWLDSPAREIAPVLGIDLRTQPCIVLDLSVSSPLVNGDPRLNGEEQLTPRIFDRMREAGVRVSVGRYDEPRLLYTADFFVAPGTEEVRRTIHLGLDLFAEAGTGVFAPLDGTVHALAENKAVQDYGPVVILRHETDDGVEFFTLYGHLSRQSLGALHVGMRLRRGDRFASLGTPYENVGWTPHLHLQIMTSLLGQGTDFPGVGDALRRDVWRAICPDPNMIVGVPRSRFPAPDPNARELTEDRTRHVGHNVRLGYGKPLSIARGFMQHLYDDGGRRYLDAFNNVPHVGHSHPRVVSAAHRQNLVLNTNTRYLHPALGEYARRLTDTLPPALEVCYFVNSGSEANELALRLARNFTKRRHVIVLEHAYHGNTGTAIDLSPYKHAGKGGEGAPSWVHVAPQPDDYRGPYRRSDPRAGEKYASDVEQALRTLRESGRDVAAFIAETCPSVGGQIIPPAGYFASVHGHLRKHGAVYVADEVQTGFGRMGTHFWAFEAHGVVPDLVVLGKPIGNGHPIGAVITTRAIAEAFDNGMEFFSTFGGSTLSCTIGLAVLDVLRDEAMQSHAFEVGEQLRALLEELAGRHACIGDVRGSGLFWGVELVRDRATLEPAGEEAAWVAEQMRESGVLIGTDGPYHNVLKIRPPMPFNEGDARQLTGALDEVLRWAVDH